MVTSVTGRESTFVSCGLMVWDAISWGLLDDVDAEVGEGRRREDCPDHIRRPPGDGALRDEGE